MKPSPGTTTLETRTTAARPKRVLLSLIWTPVVLALLAGCGAGQTSGSETAASAAPMPESTIILTDHGLDGFPAGTAFDVDLLRQAVPDYDVAEAVGGSEGMEWTIFHVLHDEDVLLEIHPDQMLARVGSIRTSSPAVDVVGALGVGSRFSAVYEPGESLDCHPGLEGKSGMVICRVPGKVQLWYEFDGIGGPDGTVPPRSALEDAVVRSVVWSIGEGQMIASTAESPMTDTETPSHPIDEALEACQVRENWTTQGINICHSEAITAWDGELNRLYQELLALADPESREMIVSAQRAWIAFRDADTAVLGQTYQPGMGSFWSNELSIYQLNRVRDRVEELEFQRSAFDLLGSL